MHHTVPFSPCGSVEATFPSRVTRASPFTFSPLLLLPRDAHGTARQGHVRRVREGSHLGRAHLNGVVNVMDNCHAVGAAKGVDAENEKVIVVIVPRDAHLVPEALLLAGNGRGGDTS